MNTFKSRSGTKSANGVSDFILRQKKSRWNSVNKQKDFLDSIALKFNISKQDDWGNLTLKDIKSNGGAGLLSKYGNSLSSLLRTVYPSKSVDSLQFSHVPDGFWKIKHNQRSFLEKLKTQLKIESPEDWLQLSAKEIRKHGGYGLLQEYGGSFSKALSSIFPEFNFEVTHFRKVPRNYWKANSRNFLNKISNKLGVNRIEDWYKVTSHQLKENGGKRILKHYGSLYHILLAAFPEVNWDPTRFERVPANYWNLSYNRRKFLENIRTELNFEMNDWGNLTTKQFNKYGGAGLLARYGGSLFRVLIDNYGEYDWSKTNFCNLNLHPQYHWDNLENSRKFLDDIAKKLGIRKPSDWGKITIRHVQLLNGNGLLHKYQNSIFRTLVAVYKDIKWKMEWFQHVPKYPREYWNRFEHQKKFMNEMSIDYGIKNFSDWQRISLSIIKARGGLGLLKRYGNSISRVLSAVYKERIEGIDFSNSTKPHKSVVKYISTWK